MAQEPERKGEQEKDDPRARQEFMEQLRGGGAGGYVPPGARLRALREMDELIREEGDRYWRTRSAASTPSTTTTSSSASLEPSIANGSPTSSQWLFIGPRPTNGAIPSSGRTSAMVVDPRDPTGNTVYIGGAQGGAWRTTDGGTNWTPLMDGANIPSLAVGSMAIDATEPLPPPCTSSAIYVGTGEQGSSFDSYYGAGVLKSCDGGTTWTQLGASKFAGPLAGCTTGANSFGYACGGAFIGGLSVRPGGANPATILAAVSIPNGFNDGPGVYRTTDGGTNWTRVLAGSTSSSLGATAVQYANANVAYAGLDGLGVYRWNSATDTWTAANGVGPSNTLAPGGRIELAVALSDATGNTVYASVGGASSGNSLAGFYKTTDGGANWTRLGPVSSPGLVDYCTPQCWYDNVVAVNPVDASVVFVGGAAVAGHVSKTINGGTNWAAATSGIHVDHHAAAFTPDGTRLYWGNDGGVYRTDNANSVSSTATWTNLNANLGLTQFYTNFALHPTDINIAFAGSQDNGTQRYDGTQDISLAWTNTGACGDGAGNVIDAFNPSVVYANCQLIDILKSTNGGLSGFAPAKSGINTGDRVVFIPPMVGDNFSGGANNLYFGTFRVWQTRNQGSSWQAISNSLTSNRITRLVVAPSDRSVMYAATEDGLVWKGTGLTAASPNDCVTLLNCFTNVTGDLLPASRRINAVAVSPFDPNTVYVGHGGFSSSTVRRLSRSTGGGSWTDITANLPNTPIQDIVVDPDIPGTIYVATDIGVFISTNDGGSWATLANGLPRLAVYGLKLHRPSRTLRAATHGRGFWDLAVPATVSGPGGILIPSSLGFGSRPLGTTSEVKSMSFVNNGTATTTIGAVTVTGDYAISSNGCSGTLAPSASCAIGITFTPTTAGLHNRNLTVTSNAVTTPTAGGLSGLGGPANDNFANATLVIFGGFRDRTNTLGATTESADPTPSCLSGSPVSKTVWYNYTPGSSGPATINTRGSNYDTVLAVFTGAPGAFTEVLNGCNDDIGGVPESPSEVMINVTGGTTYRIMISGFVPNDGGEMTFNVNGPAPAPSLKITPASLTFANQAMGTTSPAQSITLTALSGTVNNLAVSASTNFGTTSNCPSTLAFEVSCTVNVTYAPTIAGTHSGTVSVTSSGLGSPQTAALSGTADTISLAPAVLNIAAVAGRSAAPQTVTFFNGSASPVTVSSVVATGDYTVSHGCGTVPNGGSCPINVTFSPAASGPRNGVLTATTSGGTRTASLNGTGIELSLALTRPVRPGRNTAATIIISPGTSKTVELELSGRAGPDDLVTFACSGGPRGSSCRVEPGRIHLQAVVGPVKVVITSPPALAARLSRSGGHRIYTFTVTASLGSEVRSQQIAVQFSEITDRSEPRTRSQRLRR